MSVIASDTTEIIKSIRADDEKNALKLIHQWASDNTVNLKGCTSLVYAISHGEYEIVDFLIKKGSNVEKKSDFNGHRAIHIAAKHGQAKLIKLLIDTGADINAVDNKGFTALYQAVRMRHADVVKVLLDSGADTEIGPTKNKVDIETTPIFAAVDSGDSENEKDIVKMLVKAGANLNHKNNIGITPLLSSLIYGHGEGIPLLLIELGAEVNCHLYGSLYAMHIAACYGKTDVMIQLVLKGLDLNDQVNNKTSPVNILKTKHPNLFNGFLNELNKTLTEKRLSEEDMRKSVFSGFEFDI